MRSLGYLLILVAGLLAILAAVILGAGVAEPLVPDPENVTNSFLGALAAGRYEIARQELSEELKAEVSASDLQELDNDLSEQYGNYSPLPGGQTQQSGEKATYEAQVDTEVGELLQPLFELERDPKTSLWQISSIDELMGLAQG